MRKCILGVFLLLAGLAAVPVQGGILGGLGLGPGEQEFLPPEQAFIFTAEVRDGNTVVARWTIAEDYYLYRERFSFRFDETADLRVGEAGFPRGKFKEDEFFGRMEVYYGEVEVVLPVQGRTPGSPRQTVVLEVGYQGCAEKGFCYPPMKERIELVLPPTASAVPVTVVGDGPAAPLAEQDRIARELAGGRLWWNLLGFFGFGLLLAFTPCVFPMVPILSSLIVGRKEVTTARAFWLSVSYVLAMALTYTVAGVVAALFGSNLQILFQNPWVLGAFSAVFVALALSMFGLYPLQMPAALQTRLSNLSRRHGGGGMTGAAVLGFFSALIVGPCVAAPLAGILIYIGMTGDAWLGGLSLFVLSLGMGVPLIAFGTSAGKWLPRAGPWMETVRHVFGVLLLAVAVWLLERIVPPPAALVLWAVLFIIVAVYLGAFDRLERGASGWRRLGKGGGVVMAVYGVVLLVGAAGGGRDPLRPLEGVFVRAVPETAAVTGEALVFRPVKGPEALAGEVAAAAARGRPVMVDFYADWCIDCKRLERSTFSDPAVRRDLSRMVLIKADVTENDAQDQALLRAFGLFGPPAVLFFDATGREMKQYRLIGFLDPEAFRRHTSQVLAAVL